MHHPDLRFHRSTVSFPERSSRPPRPASRFRPGWIRLAAVGLAAAISPSLWAGDREPWTGSSVLQVVRQVAPPGPTTAETAAPDPPPPQLLPPPVPAASGNAVENLPPAKDNAPVCGMDRLDPGLRSISSVTIGITPPAARDDQGRPLDLPPDAARQYFAQQLPATPPSVPYSSWMQDNSYGPALNFCYRPLFFEDVNLERYGHNWGVLQPAVSAAKFYGNVALVPYRLATQHPRECTYHDHHYRPGAPAPREIQVPKRLLSHLTD